MRVLITGATGFVGRRLCRVLAEGGHELAALSRDPEAAMRELPQLADAYPWHPAAPPPAESVATADAVVHLAGETVVGRWTAEKRRRIRDSRVLGTRHLVDAIEAAEPA